MTTHTDRCDSGLLDESPDLTLGFRPKSRLRLAKANSRERRGFCGRDCMTQPKDINGRTGCTYSVAFSQSVSSSLFTVMFLCCYLIVLMFTIRCLKINDLGLRMAG